MKVLVSVITMSPTMRLLSLALPGGAVDSGETALAT